MIAGWMLYALLVGALVASAAWLLEEGIRLRGGPVRFVWLGALAATVALAALAPLRAAAPAPLAAPDAIVESSAAPSAEPGAGRSPVADVLRALAAARTALGEPLRQAATLGGGTAGRVLGAGWVLLSAGLLLLLAATAARGRRARRRWPVARVAGEPVRVSPDAGPAVLGVLRPEVVIPAWLLDAPADEQRLVVLHEREHLRARDPLLLAVGCLAVALMPWNPAAWWMLLRLRTAVELDCDARVLRRGVAPRAYGTLLIDMAGRGPGLSLGTPALAGTPSTLERRIRAMNARLPRFARLRAGLMGVLGLALLAGACETALPTTAEVEAMDGAAVQARAARLGAGGEVTYFVDGREVTMEEARALTSDRTVRMEMTAATADGRRTVRIYTTAEAAAAAGGADARRAQVAARAGTAVPLHVAPTGDAGTRVRTPEHFQGLLIIDGAISDARAMAALEGEHIDQIEVIKGAAATQVYDDPRAAYGVIRITTKLAPANR